MLPFFEEYHVRHRHFREHLRIALILALVAPACAAAFFQTLGWWNPWLWGTCGAGLALALALFSMVRLIQTPHGLSRAGRKLHATADNWFPYFFVFIQSSIAALVLMFLWFSLTALILAPPRYLNITVVIIAHLIPVRRLWQARARRDKTRLGHPSMEIIRCLWHLAVTVFITGLTIRLTVSDPNAITPENIAWQVILWVPSSLYMLFTVLVTMDHIFHLSARLNRPRPDHPIAEQDHTTDRF
jgi:hypothetical protein